MQKSMVVHFLDLQPAIFTQKNPFGISILHDLSSNSLITEVWS